MLEEYCRKTTWMFLNQSCIQQVYSFSIIARFLKPIHVS